MNRTSHICRQFISVVFITVFALTSVPLVTDSIAAERERTRNIGNRLEQTQGKRVERERTRSSDNRLQQTQGKRVERERTRSSDKSLQQTQGKRVERERTRSNDKSLRRDQGTRVEKFLSQRRSNKKRRVISPRPFRQGHAVPRLPRGYQRAWYNRMPYYYSSGIFYRPGLSGYVVVRAPFGSIVVSLPVGYQRLWIDNTAYYAYGGYFYKRVPAGYVVVEPPATVEFEEVDPDIIQPSRTATGEVSVTAPVLNVRSGPSLNDPKIYQIHEGYILEIHGKSDGWLYVQLPNGEFGWVKSVFTKPLETARG